MSRVRLKQHSIWRAYLAFVAVVCLVVASLTWYVAYTFKQFHIAKLSELTQTSTDSANANTSSARIVPDTARQLEELTFSSTLYRIYFLEFLVVVGIATYSYILYRRVDRPLRKIREGAEKFAQGELHEKLPLSGIREVDEIVFSMNSMARRLSRLEEVRRDFVANVSHELKTPITLIKGFVETLIDGARNNPQDADRFLQILASQSNRLNTIIDDLLTLARLEGETEKELMLIRSESIAELLKSVEEACHARAANKEISIKVECRDDISVALDRSLAEQAIINLVDNAIKYSATKSEIKLSAYEHDQTVVVSVSDEGPGIPAEHLPRLFERFYRVDKARSRNLGGTGLGLSIVKHIATVHGGSVDVHSIVGTGSEFRIHFPK